MNRYNIFVKMQMTSWYLFDLSEEKMKNVVHNYHSGKSKFTISGVTHTFNKVIVFRVFTMQKEVDEIDFLINCRDSGLTTTQFMTNKLIFTPEAFLLLGNEVTNDFVGDVGFGEAKEDVSKNNSLYGQRSYVDPARIKEIRSLNSNEFDLSRLIALCEEINSAYSNDSVFSVGMLLRAIIDYVPPIFGYPLFNELANNYKAGGKSHGKLFKNLQNFFRNTADGYLHTQARKKDSIPLMKQVDYQSELDVLLSEIVRILK